MGNYIIGLNFGHDATVVVMEDGEIVEAMMEERLTRVKKYIGFPHEALAYIKKKYPEVELTQVYADATETGYHIINTKADVIEYHSRFPLTGNWFTKAMVERIPFSSELYRLKDALYGFRFRLTHRKSVVNDFLKTAFPSAAVVNVPHHLSHAWAAVPFIDDLAKKRLIITLDGEGDELCGSINLFENGNITVLHEFSNLHSLGLLYASFVDLLGMTRNQHEFKVMGLAPYAKASSGEKVYQKLAKLLWFNEGTMTLESKLDMRRATPYLIAEEYHHHRFDSLAYGIQKLTEELTKQMTRAAIRKYRCGDVVLGGGVFMNVKANQYLRELPEVDSLVVTPSAGDESIAIGNAVFGYAKQHNHDLSGLKPIQNLYLGSSYTEAEIKAAIDAYPEKDAWTITHFDESRGESIEKKVAELLAGNSVVGRFKGRAEWGARALGNRSILANPSSRDNVKLINEMIKGRDFWMPFATSMLYERRNEYLKNADDYLAPYMAITFETTERAHSELIAALHPYDLTSRPQMVEKGTNPEYHALISHFEALTGIGGILNTSFNLHGEPNVETPYDALRTFALSGLPHLAIGNYLLSK